MATGQIYKLALVGQGPNGQKLVQTFHYRADGGPIADTQSHDLALAWIDGAVGTFLSTFTNQSNLIGIEVRGVTDPTEGYDYSFPTPQAGGRAGESLPPQSSAVITWTTGKVGRRYRGRSFFWPAMEDDQAGGQWESAYITALAAFANDSMLLASSAAHAQYTQVVYSRTFAISTQVSGFVVRNTVYTQRRRVAGAGA